MKILWTSVVMLLIISGCGLESEQKEKKVSTEAELKDNGQSNKKNEKDNDQSDKKSDVEVTNDENTDSDKKSTSNEESKSSETETTTVIDAEFIIKNIKLGLTEDQVVEFLGKPNVKGVNPMHGSPMWRYDFGAIKKTKTSEEQVDVVNAEALENGKLDFQLFISWSDKKISTFSNYVYRDGQIGEYRVFENGKVKKTY